MNEYLPEPKSFGGKVKVELDLTNYAAKADFKNSAGIDTSKFAKKIDLASLKSNVDKFYIDKSKNVPSNVSNLKSKVDKLDVDILVPAPVRFRENKFSRMRSFQIFCKNLFSRTIKFSFFCFQFFFFFLCIRMEKILKKLIFVNTTCSFTSHQTEITSFIIKLQLKFIHHHFLH